jgi:hypothetical protein
MRSGRGPIYLPAPVDDAHPLNKGRLAWWLPLPRHGFGGVLVDLMGRANGTLTSPGSELYWSGASNPTGFPELVFAPAAGSNNVAIGDLSTLVGTEASLTAWVKNDLATPVDASKSGLFSFDTCGTGGATVYPYTDGTVYIGTLRGPDASARVSFANSGFDKSAWHHLAVTTMPGTNGYVIYQDGATAYSTTGLSTAYLGTTSFIGYESTFGARFSGRFGPISIWNRALTAAEVALDRDLGRAGYPGVLRRRGATYAPEQAAAAANIAKLIGGGITSGALVGGGLAR